MENNENFDLLFKYHRLEQSKNTNGSEEVFILKGNSLSFKEHHWGFKSESRPKINETKTLSAKDLKKITDFIEEKKLNVSENQKIEEKNNFSFNTFTYTLINKLSQPPCEIELITNNLQCDDTLLLKLSKFNTLLKLMFI